MRKLRSLLVLGVLAAVCGLGSSVASAVSVEFVTTGVFSGAQGTISTTTTTNDTLLIGNTTDGIKITFGGAANTGVGAVTPPTSVDLGTFTVTQIGNGVVTGTLTDQFVLSVFQSVPSDGGALSFGQGNLAGSISISGSTAYVLFSSPLTITVPSLPPIIYSIVSADFGVPGEVQLKPPGVLGSASTTIQGFVVAAPVPAAAWMGLSTLAGLAGMGLVRRRRSV